MAHARDSARSYGKSDPIDAPRYRVRRRENPICRSPVSTESNAKSESSSITEKTSSPERTRIIARLRWHLHTRPRVAPPTKMDRASAFTRIQAHVSSMTGLVADLANRLVDHLRRLAVEVYELAAEITSQATVFAPSLPAILGCAALTAAKIFGEAAQVSRFHSKDAFALFG